MRRRRACGTVIAAFALGCMGRSNKNAAPDATVDAAPDAMADAAPDAMADAASGNKSALCGLVTMGKPAQLDPPDNSLKEANAHPGVYRGVVILATWAQLQPTDGTTIDTTAIDDGLAAVDAYNAANSPPVGAKLRIFGGTHAPTWAQQLDNGPLSLVDSGNPVTVGHCWSQAYRSAWTDLQDLLAQKYDSDPRVREVAVTGPCMVVTAEPFITPTNPTSIASYQAAGYTDAAYEAALASAKTAYAAWTKSALDYTFNPWLDIDSGSPVLDNSFAFSVMSDWRASLGTRAVLANHGLQPTLATDVEPLYDGSGAGSGFAQLGAPLEFQTLAPTTDQSAAATKGFTYAPSEIEMWDSTAAGGTADITSTMLSSWAAQFTCSD